MGIVFHHEKITVEENRLRNERLQRYYDPETGEGSDIGDRQILRLPDAPIPVQHVPAALLDNEPLARRLAKAGSLSRYIELYGDSFLEKPAKKEECHKTKRKPGKKQNGTPDTTQAEESLAPDPATLWRAWGHVRIRYDLEGCA